MEEAFQSALDRVVRRHAKLHIDRRNLQVVAGVTARRSGVFPVSSAALAKLVYGGTKLGRRWSSYTNQDGDAADWRL